MAPSVDCTNFSTNSSLTPDADRFGVTNECAQFDFIVYTCAGGTLFFFGVIGNAISFAVMLNDGPPRSATSFLLQALAVADTLVLVTALPLYILPSVYTHTGVGQVFYDFNINALPFLWPIYLVPYTGTIFLTVLVSVNRYEAVCRPFNTAKLCSNDKVRRHVIYIAVFSLLYNIPRFFEYQKVEVCTGLNVSKEAFDISSFGGNTVYRVVYANILYFVVMLGGPLISLAFLNANLIRALKVQARRRCEMGVTSSSGSQTDVTLVLVVVVFVFILCQTPTFIDHILWTVLDESDRQCGRWHYYYTAVGDLLAICNSSVNFVIYVLTSPKFRQNLASMFGLQNRSGTPLLRRADERTAAGATAMTSVFVRVTRKGMTVGSAKTVLGLDGGVGSGNASRRLSLPRRVAGHCPNDVDDGTAETIMLYRPAVTHGAIDDVVEP